MSGEPAPELRPTAELLGAVFPGAGLDDERYLGWLYRDAPDGPVIERNVDDADGRVGHYAITPIDLADPTRGAVRGALSLNTAVHERGRGRGLFVELAEATYADATQVGVEAVVGVANANSTPGFVRRLGFSLVGPLSVEAIPPLPGLRRGLRATDADDERAVASLLAEREVLLVPPQDGLARRWSPAALAWRLAAPGRRYALHDDDGLVAVSTVVARRGVRIAVLCALFAPAPLTRRVLLGVAGDVRRHWRARLAIHVGINRRLPRVGPALPDRLRESPLNLIYRDLAAPGGAVPPIARWEAIDFDAF